MDMIFHLLLVVTLGLGSCYEDNNPPVLGQPVLDGPSVALVKKAVEFYCDLFVYPNNETILLQLFKEGDHEKLLGEYTSLNGEQGVIPIVSQTSHDGKLECVASAQNNTSIQPTVSISHHFKVIEPVKKAEVEVSSGRTEFFEGSTLELQCKLEKGNYVTYEWLLDGQNITATQYRHLNESQLKVFRASSKDSGSYMCVARNSYNKTIYHTQSSAVHITVKDAVSAPDISFTVLREGLDYFVLVSCHSLRGTPPITFSLYLKDTLYNLEELIGNMTVEDRNATFNIPIVLRQHHGQLQCRAENGDQVKHSRWEPLHVALANLIIRINGSESLRPVLSGPTMAYLNSRAAFRCMAPGAPPPVTYELVKDQNTPIHKETDLQGDQPAPFFLRVAMTSGGSYHCTARADDREGVSNSIRLTVVIPPSETRVTSEPFPPVAYEGSRVVFRCNVSRGSHLSYFWFFNRREMQSSALPLHHIQGNSLVIERVRPEHGGHYSCMAWSTVQDLKRFSSSREVQLTVKVYVTKPQISFSVSKEAAGGFVGNISCSVSRGSPPINFMLLLENRAEGEVTASESHTVWFDFPFVPGLQMGKARCRAKTEVQDVLSEPLLLEVVPVGGHVKVQVDYFYTADHKATAAKLGCQISQGTFPFVIWLHNSSVLPSETKREFYIPQISPPFAFTDQGRTLILTKLGPEVFGFYQCKARDSYNENGPWVESVSVQIKGSLSPCPKPLLVPPPTALPNVSAPLIESIAIAFCCFVLLALIMGVACVHKMVDQRRDTQVTETHLIKCPISPSHSRPMQENTQNQMSTV